MVACDVREQTAGGRVSQPLVEGEEQSVMNRRRFLQASAGAAAFLAFRRQSMAFAQSPTTIPLFGTTLRGIGTIGVAAPDLAPAPVTGVTHYTIGIDEFNDAGVCPALGPTMLRGFNPARLLAGQNNRHLGGIIVGQRGQPVQITFRNNLPAGMHVIPNDLTIMGANQGNNRVAVHFHGGLVPWISDGGPFDWFDPAGVHGSSFLNNLVLNPGAALNEGEYYYGLNQSARFGWYHDHAFGITRINAYAGIASGLIIRDLFELNLVNQGLPNYIEAGGNEIPLVFQDKIFVGPATAALDPTWAAVSKATTPGSLWYAHFYEKNRWRLSGNTGGGNLKNLAVPDPSCIPEFFGDTMLVNGTTFPKAAVEPRRYRLRLLNACNARFLNLQLYIADGSPNGITLNAVTGNPTNAPALCDPNTPGTSATLLQIGTEGGFLPAPVKMPTNLPFNPVTFTGSLIVAPAERPDIIVDFSACAGKSVILYNDAPSPFPMGDPRNDYFPLWNVKLNPVNALTPNGFGPNSRVLMRFDVAPAITGTPDVPMAITTATSMAAGIDAPLVPFGVSTPPPGVPVRILTLNEAFDAYGRLVQMLGTNIPLASPSAGFGRAYTDPVTETVTAGTTEVWEVYNTTADVHPMHFHLVNVQVINRQAFQNFNGTPTFKAAPTPPPANETGWKETVPMYPGTVTRIIMKFDLPQILTPGGAVIPTPASPRTGGNEYVWHCHILEHEEHDMMRPLVVT
jgi:FtsP/CotA-like multicopper oxidase with cupredoxin domain